MAVDIRLNEMINALDAQLDRVLLEDVELSVRSFAALTRCGAVTIGDAKRALKDGSFRKQKNIGPRAVREVEEIIRNVAAVLPIPAPKTKRERQLERVLEMFLSWTGALAQVGSATPEAWRELVVLRQEAEVVLCDD